MKEAYTPKQEEALRRRRRRRCWAAIPRCELLTLKSNHSHRLSALSTQTLRPNQLTGNQLLGAYYSLLLHMNDHRRAHSAISLISCSFSLYFYQECPTEIHNLLIQGVLAKAAAHKEILGLEKDKNNPRDF